MRILHLNTNDMVGGAARAAYRLHMGLRQTGYDSTMFVLSRRSNDPSVQAFDPPREVLARIRRRLCREQIERAFLRYRETRPAGLESFTDDRTEHGASVLEQLPPHDVLNLHWIRDFIDVSVFFEAVSVPVVWTLHDMNAFTGGCHYDDGCGKYTASCGACPQLGSTREHDLSRQIWKRKSTAFNGIETDRLHIVTPSRWLAREVARSALLRRFPVSVIPNGLDTDVFAPRDRVGVRQALGLPSEARVLLFVAGSAVNRRKGFALLADALHGLSSEKDLILLSVGGGNPAVYTNLPHVHVGPLEQERLLSLVYSAADVFVIPSQQDNLPNTVLEAMACGTPVVGFAAGGITDLVRPGVTGWLVPAGDVRALRETLEQVVRDDQKASRMSEQCRRIAVEEYALDVQARRYATLYEEMRSGSATSMPFLPTQDAPHALTSFT